MNWRAMIFIAISAFLISGLLTLAVKALSR